MPMPSHRDATSATFSACGRYPYMLTRAADVDAADVTHPAAVFIMLNPSTADASLDDPTIRRCRHFAKAWSCDGIAVVNFTRCARRILPRSGSRPIPSDHETTAICARIACCA